MTPNKTNRSLKLFTRIIACLVVLVSGVLGMTALAKMKQPPAKGDFVERPLRVEALAAKFTDVAVQITGYGEIKALNVVSIAPEISGKITFVHPRLEVGELIPGGETLFEIDPRDYEIALKGAAATVAQWRNTILRLQTQYKIDNQRAQTLKRNRDLAKAHYDRLYRLFKTENIGTLAGVEQAEQALNAAADQLAQMARVLELNPIQIKEAKNSLVAAQAQQKIARVRLQRCRVVAPFAGRVKTVALEKGQYVTPGHNVITLADDTILEIQVPLDSNDAARWLRFDGGRARKDSAWFNGLEKTVCTIRWTEADAPVTWTGRLNRIVNFDPQTRTLTIAVRVDPPSVQKNSYKTLPLVEGMFCAVIIPGQTLKKVIRLPREAVSFENTVYLAQQNRLKTVPVEVARIQGETTWVKAGINPGDMVITTRLIDPLENALLEIDKTQSTGGSS
jgi:RND family efflux transporter MFP subunit